MDYFLIKICFVSACIGWVYVDKLTANRGLFDFIPKYYPSNSFIEQVLRCPHCTGGWLSIFSSIAIFGSVLISNDITIMHVIMYVFYCIVAPFITMAFVNIIK